MTFEEYWWIGICANPNMARDTLLKQIAESAWNAGAKAEREECANVCDALSEEAWKRYKKMYYPHDEGLSDGAAACANDIRARSNGEVRGASVTAQPACEASASTVVLEPTAKDE